MPNPITVPLPADLPTNWVNSQIVSPDGVSVGLTAKHGYNYLMQQVNNAQQAASELGEAFDERTTFVQSLPSQNGSVIFNGAVQSPAWVNYDPDKLTIGGTTSASAVGSYTATFAPKTGYTWSDGTTTTKSATWTITEEVLTVPVVTQPLVFNGQEQSPSFSNYDSTKLTISLTPQSAIGSYNAAFTPKTGFKWPDGTATFKNVAWSIVAKNVAVPTQAGTLSFNGQAQSPVFYYDTDELTLGGVTSATNPGSYAATFTPKAGHTWDDGTATAQTVNWAIAEKALNVPAQSGTVIYNGTAQSPAWDGYDPTELTIGGTTSGTDAGSYNATFTPKTGYKWADGTTGAKTVAWTITAASDNSRSITLEATNWSNGTQTVIVTGMTASSNGVFGLSQGATSAQHEAYSNAQILVTGQASGTITVTAFGGTPDVDIPCTFIFIV